MKLILNDLTNEYNSVVLPSSSDETKIFSAIPMVKPCTSCFGCWLKTPGICVIEDRAQEFLRLLAKSDELHIVSKLLYGGVSTEVKAVMDRSLGFILPFFDLLDNRMHHPPRYARDFKIHYHLYSFDGTTMSEYDIKTMKGISAGNARNFTASEHTCAFYYDPDRLREALK